jgi:cell wall assembly regulator SMI1
MSIIDMKSLWEKLKIHLCTRAPNIVADLNPPATQDEILALEQQIGMRLPSDLVACLRVHNGQIGKAEGLFDGQTLLPLNHILMSWLVWRDLLHGGDFDDRIAHSELGIKSTWWNTNWIPFASNGGGDYLCLDMDPAPGGNIGQVIEVLHDFPSRSLLKDDFFSWFSSQIHNKFF